MEKKLHTNEKPVKNYFLYYFVKVTGVIPALFLMPKVYYVKNLNRVPKGRLLIVANHSTMFDVPAILCGIWYRQIHFVAAKELFETRLGNFFFRNMHCIKVDRENFRMSSIRQIGDVLSKNKPVAIFPEGHIVEGQDELGDFKSGVSLMAYMNNSDILPVYVGQPTNHRRRILVIGDLIHVSAKGSFPSLKELEETSAMIRNKEMELENYYKGKIR